MAAVLPPECVLYHHNPFALRKAAIVYSFGLSVCTRVKKHNLAVQFNHLNADLKECLFQSGLEKKTTRQKSMENRLRLGQFVTQRQGASFVENWVDGWAFTDLMR